MEAVHESVRHFLNSLGTALTPRTPSSRGGFNRSVTRVFAEILSGPHHAFLDHWTRSSSLPLMTMHGAVLLSPVEYFRLVMALESHPQLLAFRNFASLTRISASRRALESTEPYISFATTKGYKKRK